MNVWRGDVVFVAMDPDVFVLVSDGADGAHEVVCVLASRVVAAGLVDVYALRHELLEVVEMGVIDVPWVALVLDADGGSHSGDFAEHAEGSHDTDAGECDVRSTNDAPSEEEIRDVSGIEASIGDFGRCGEAAVVCAGLEAFVECLEVQRIGEMEVDAPGCGCGCVFVLGMFFHVLLRHDVVAVDSVGFAFSSDR